MVPLIQTNMSTPIQKALEVKGSSRANHFKKFSFINSSGGKEVPTVTLRGKSAKDARRTNAFMKKFMEPGYQAHLTERSKRRGEED